VNDFIRITYRGAEGCSPAEATIEIGQPTKQGPFSSVLEAFAEGQKVGADNILEANAIEARQHQLEWSNTLCNGERVNYKKAEKACAALGEGWRLPTRAELLSLVDDTRCDPAIDTARFPDTKSGAYWTGTPLASDSSYAWVVVFSLGYADSYHRDGSYAFVRAVRSVPAGQ
jgi:hypothetical protein